MSLLTNRLINNTFHSKNNNVKESDFNSNSNRDDNDNNINNFNFGFF